MQRRFFCSIALASLLAGATLSKGFADATADAKKQIQAEYNKIDAAAAKKDVKGMTASMTSDFVDTNEKGEKTALKDLREKMGQVLAMTKSLKIKTTVEKVTLKGSTATASVKQTADISQLPPNVKTPVKMHSDETLTSVWVKSGAGWKIKSSKTNTSKQTLDGKPMP
jgi:ketosteroid isomerase-like protein